MTKRILFSTLALVTLLFACACKSSENHPATNSGSAPASSVASPAAGASPAVSSSTSRVDPCRLLTSDELKEVQGEALKEASRSDRQNPEFDVAQCYYLLPTAANSVALSVTTARAGGKGIKEFWERTFREAPDARGDKGDTEEASARPEKISGIGEQAYWEASGVGGALYVLQHDVIFRLSVGGSGDIKTKLSKSKTLARKALARI